MKLDDKGITMNLKKIRRIMKKYGLICKIRRVNKARVSLQKNIENQEVANLLNRKFKQNIPYSFASTDITYLKHQGRFSFLSVIKDLATGEILT
jgi:transposase InsO family protein